MAGAAVLWSVARRAPIEEARQFLNGPVEVGDQPPPAAPAPAADPAARYAAADEAFAAGRWREAAEGYAAVVAADPAAPRAGRAQWQLTRSRLRSGDGNGALAAFRDLTGHYAGYLGEQSPALREGLELMQAGKLDAAQRAFERVVREQPDSEFVPLAHALVARIHWAHGEPVETVRAFARMFASVRDAVPAYADLGRSLARYAEGDEEAPEEFGRLAREGDTGFRDIYQYLAARSLLEQDRFTATHDALEELRRRYPGGDFTHIVDLEHAWNLLRNGQAEKALAIFERLEHTPPPADAAAFDEFFDLRAELPMGVARCQLQFGHYEEAAAGFERALAANPTSIYDVENRLGLSSAYEHMGRLDRAADTLREAIERHPDEPKLWAMRQQLARIEGKREAADR